MNVINESMTNILFVLQLFIDLSIETDKQVFIDNKLMNIVVIIYEN